MKPTSFSRTAETIFGILMLVLAGITLFTLIRNLRALILTLAGPNSAEMESFLHNYIQTSITSILTGLLSLAAFILFGVSMLRGRRDKLSIIGVVLLLVSGVLGYLLSFSATLSMNGAALSASSSFRYPALLVNVLSLLLTGLFALPLTIARGCLLVLGRKVMENKTVGKSLGTAILVLGIVGSVLPLLIQCISWFMLPGISFSILFNALYPRVLNLFVLIVMAKWYLAKYAAPRQPAFDSMMQAKYQEIAWYEALMRQGQMAPEAFEAKKQEILHRPS